MTETPQAQQLAISDLQYVAEPDQRQDCLLCGDAIEHGQIRARIEYYGEIGWAHDHCAEDADQPALDGSLSPVMPTRRPLVAIRPEHLTTPRNRSAKDDQS